MKGESKEKEHWKSKRFGGNVKKEGKWREAQKNPANASDYVSKKASAVAVITEHCFVEQKPEPI